jgi:ubiquinone/menaquinone biosynthesis C-methylase UbiE
MTQKDKTQYYDELGDRFEEYMSDYDVERRHWLVFRTLLGGEDLRASRVLEIGSGTGRFSKTAQQLGGRLTVLDIGEKLVAAVADELGCEGVNGDALSLPLRADSFDLIISSECIEHTLDPEQAIREMCRVCRPGGLVCITAPNRFWYPVLVLSQKLGLRDYSGIENWMFPGRAGAIMRQAGMGQIRLAGCHLWPFQLKFSRPLLRKLDALGKSLYPVMINFGIVGRKRT